MTLANASRVVINAQLMSGSASYRSAGISTYLSYLLSHLKQESLVDYYVLFGNDADPSLTTLPYTQTRFPTDHPFRRIIWEQMILPIWLSRLRADILHAPAFVGPVFSPCPQVITVHDLSFIRYPHFFKGPNRLYLSLMTGFSCRRAAAVIAVSEFTASEVKRLLRVKPGKIHTVYHGVDQRFKPLPQNAIDAFKSRKGLPERFILFLGTLEPRKNLIQLVRAYAKLPQKSTHLILAGAQGWFYQELYAVVEELGLQKYVHFPGYISGEEQVLWYNAASVFAYVSTYEGFGLPVLEALACGVPTLTSTSSSLPEAAGNGALQAKSDDEQDIADKLTLLLANSELRESLRLNGLEHASHFTWELTAQKTRRVYTDVLNRN